MVHEWLPLIILLFGGMLAGVVDTVIGGGGLFSIPALFLTGMAPQAVLGTNQFALSFGSLVGTVKFSQKGNINWWPETILCAIGVIPGTFLGGMAALALPQRVLHFIIIILLIIVGIVVIIKRDLKENVTTASKNRSFIQYMLIFLLGIGIGFYEGFFGPGTGIIITFSFVMWFGANYVKASGAAKAISLLGNVTAFITYAIHGDVMWIEGLIMAVAVSIGAYIGANVAQRGGKKVIRPVMLGVIVLLVVNVVSSLF